MSKITALNPVAPEDVDGTEVVVVVKDGETKRSTIADLVAGPVEQAEAAVASAVALINFHPGTLAEAEAANEVGDAFAVEQPAASGLVSLRRRTIGGSNQFALALTMAALATSTMAAAIGTETGDSIEQALAQRDFVVGNFAQIATAKIPANTAFIRTLEYGPRAGRGGGVYRKWTNARPALPAWAEGVTWITNTASNTRWYLDAGPLASSDMFGTVGDGVMNYGATAPTAGTEVSTQLNDARRWLLDREWGNGGVLTLSQGQHRLENEWMLSLGADFTRGLTVYGEGTERSWGLWDGQSIPCSRIVTSRNDLPLLSVQGARGGECVGIAVHGPLASMIAQNLLFRGVAPFPATDDRLQSQVLPVTGPHTNGRYNAGCAFAIDPRSGVRPSGSYPDAPYNAAAGELTTQYGRSGSSDYVVRGCHFGGFSICVGVQVCDFDGNGDYIHTPDNKFHYCLNGLVICHSQARQADTSNLDFAAVHTIINGNDYGKQRGNISGTHPNWTGGHVIRVVAYNCGFTGALSIPDMHIEGFYRIADIVGNGGASFAAERASWQYGSGSSLLGSGGLPGVSPIRGRPKNHIGVSATSASAVACPVIITGQISTVGPFVIRAGAVETDISMTALAFPVGATCPQYRSAWLNATACGLACWPKHSTFAERHIIRVNRVVYDVSATPNAVQVGSRHFDGMVAQLSSRSQPAPLWAQQYRGAQCHTPAPLPRRIRAISPGTGATLVKNVLRMTYAGYTAAGHIRRFNMMAGCPVEHSSGFLGVVAGYDTATDQIVIVIDNGWAESAGGVVSWEGGDPLASLSSGTWYMHDGTRYGPSNPLVGDFTAGTANITNVGVRQGAGAATAIATDVGVGDHILFDEEEDGLISTYRNFITVVTAGTPGSITGTAGWGANLSATRRRLTFGSGIVPNVLNP